MRAAGAAWVLLKAYAYDGAFPASGCVRQNDLDILIRSADLGPAVAVLERLGYARVARPWNDEYRYKRPDATPVDLHVSYNPHLEWATGEEVSERAMTRAEQISNGDWQLPVLHPLDNSVFFLVHTALHHNFAPLSKVVACWNALVHWQDRIDAGSLSEELRAIGVGHLGSLAVDYLERLVGCPLGSIVRFDEDSAWWERLAFAWCLPKPGAYLSAAAQTRLTRRRRDGFHLCLYPNTWKRKVMCLGGVLRARWERTR